MLRCIFFLRFIWITFATNQSTRNVPQLDGKIIGGTPVEINDFPYQLSLEYYGSHICGASLISHSWAITAAHCTDNRPKSSLQIRAGSTIRGYSGKIVNIKTIHQHPKYNSVNFDYDISVLKLNSSLKYSKRISRIALPYETQAIPVGKMAVVSGWSILYEGAGSSPCQLQAIYVSVYNSSNCEVIYGSDGENYVITERMMCAGEPLDADGGKDICQGDSGGPLVFNKKLIGVVSWGRGCTQSSYPDVYANVANLRGYIKNITGI